MTTTPPNPIRTLESHGVFENGSTGKQGECKHYMVSIRTGGERVMYVEQCVKCQWIDPASLDWWAENAIKLAGSDRAKRIAASASTEPFAFVQQEGEELTLTEILYQALGAASMCWEHPDRAGIFDSTRAKMIGEALEREVRRAMKSPG